MCTGTGEALGITIPRCSVPNVRQRSCIGRFEPGQKATLSMNGLAFSGEMIGIVRFESLAALTVSTLQCLIPRPGPLAWLCFRTAGLFRTTETFRSRKPQLKCGRQTDRREDDAGEEDL